MEHEKEEYTNQVLKTVEALCEFFELNNVSPNIGVNAMLNLILSTVHGKLLKDQFLESISKAWDERDEEENS